MTLDPMTFEYYCEKHKILKLALNDSYPDKQVRHFCLLLVLDQVILTLVDYNSFNEYSLGQIKVKMRSRLEELSFFITGREYLIKIVLYGIVKRLNRNGHFNGGVITVLKIQYLEYEFKLSTSACILSKSAHTSSSGSYG